MTTTVVRKIYEFNKAVVDNSAETARNVASVVGDGVSNAFHIARDVGATVVGQAQSAGKRTADQASKGAKEVVGQTRAQGKRGADRLDEVTERTARKAVDAVDSSPSSGTPYEQWSKADLYERAQELDIDGRSTMSKQQLISALRSH